MVRRKVKLNGVGIVVSEHADLQARLHETHPKAADAIVNDGRNRDVKVKPVCNLGNVAPSEIQQNDVVQDDIVLG